MTQPDGKTPATFDLRARYVQLDDGPGLREIAVDEEFWQRIGERPALQAGRMAMIGHCGADWTHWEMHPDGDELVCLLSGAIDLVLDLAGGEHTVALRDGGSVIVPRGIWHRAIVQAPGDLLFVTRGAGTQHRPV